MAVTDWDQQKKYQGVARWFLAQSQKMAQFSRPGIYVVWGFLLASLFFELPYYVDYTGTALILLWIAWATIEMIIFFIGLFYLQRAIWLLEKMEK